MRLHLDVLWRSDERHAADRAIGAGGPRLSELQVGIRLVDQLAERPGQRAGSAARAVSPCGQLAQQKRPTIKAFQITADTEDGFRLGKVGYKEDGSIGSVEGEVEFTLPSTVRLDLVNGVPPKSIMRLVIMPTPIDENNTISYFERGRHTEGLDRLRWWFAWKFKYRSRIGRVVDQDRTLLTALGPIGETRLHEHLASSDVASSTCAVASIAPSPPANPSPAPEQLIDRRCRTVPSDSSQKENHVRERGSYLTEAERQRR